MTNHTQSQHTKSGYDVEAGKQNETLHTAHKTADTRRLNAEGEQSPSLEYKKQKENRFKKEIAECENEIRDLREEIKFLKRCIENYKYD